MFWFGDLNYRIDYFYDGVMKFIDDKNYHELLERDQVNLPVLIVSFALPSES